MKNRLFLDRIKTITTRRLCLRSPTLDTILAVTAPAATATLLVVKDTKMTPIGIKIHYANMQPAIFQFFQVPAFFLSKNYSL